MSLPSLPVPGSSPWLTAPTRPEFDARVREVGLGLAIVDLINVPVDELSSPVEAPAAAPRPTARKGKRS